MKRSLFAPLVLAAAAAAALAGAGAASAATTAASARPPTCGPRADLAPPLLSCSMTIDEYCATSNANCIRDLNLADTNGAWCSDAGVIISATRKFCGNEDFTITAQYSDTSTVYMYRSIQLYAIFTQVPHAQDFTCLAGPSQASLPIACTMPHLYCM